MTDRTAVAADVAPGNWIFRISVTGRRAVTALPPLLEPPATPQSIGETGNRLEVIVWSNKRQTLSSSR